MAQQYADDVRNAMLDAIETVIGVSAILEIRSLAQPANCAAADAGTLLASLTLPVDWMGAAASGVKSMLGTWEDLSADATGTAAHFRIKTSGGVCKWQGSVTATGGGGDLTVVSTSFALGQAFTITSFTLTMGGA